MARFRRLARDDERLAETLAGLHFVVFAILMAHRFVRPAWHQLHNRLWGPRPAVRDGFVAWPPSGYVPAALVYNRWSFMLEEANFEDAIVSVRLGESALPVQMEPGAQGYCENTLVWIPTIPWDTLDSSQEHRVDVTIANVLVDGQRRDFAYDVRIFFPD